MFNCDQLTKRCIIYETKKTWVVVRFGGHRQTLFFVQLGGGQYDHCSTFNLQLGKEKVIQQLVAAATLLPMSYAAAPKKFHALSNAAVDNQVFRKLFNVAWRTNTLSSQSCTFPTSASSLLISYIKRCCFMNRILCFTLMAKISSLSRITFQRCLISSLNEVSPRMNSWMSWTTGLRTGSAREWAARLSADPGALAGLVVGPCTTLAAEVLPAIALPVSTTTPLLSTTLRWKIYSVLVTSARRRTGSVKPNTCFKPKVNSLGTNISTTSGSTTCDPGLRHRFRRNQNVYRVHIQIHLNRNITLAKKLT